MPWEGMRNLEAGGVKEWQEEGERRDEEYQEDVGSGHAGGSATAGARTSACRLLYWSGRNDEKRGRSKGEEWL